MTPEQPISIETDVISAPQTRGLRSQILRPGQPPEATVYPGDEAETTRHIGGFLDIGNGRHLIGIASIYREAMPDDSHTPGLQVDRNTDWRLRGMAVLPKHRRSGAGRALYRACLDHVRSVDGRRLWFNARTRALAFYRSLGAEVLSAEYDLPGIGPHVRMASRISPPSP